MVQVISATLQPSLCATEESNSRQLRVGLYQMKWYDNASEHLHCKEVPLSLAER